MTRRWVALCVSAVTLLATSGIIVAVSNETRQASTPASETGGHGFGYTESPVTEGVYDRAADGATFKEYQRGEALVAKDLEKPRFTGWTGGVFLLGKLRDVAKAPQGAWQKTNCETTETVRPPAELEIPSPSNPPPGFTEVGSQWGNSCSGKLVGVQRDWNFRGTGAEFHAVHFLDRLAVPVRAPLDRIHSGTLGGRDAVVVEAVNEAGFLTSWIVVPEGKNVWMFTGLHIPMSDLRALSAAVLCDNGRSC